MTRVLSVSQILRIHSLLMEQAGSSAAVRDLAGLASAAGQPSMSFDGQDLYPDILEKAAALGFSLIRNHPFVDGNKRIGHASMEVMLALNGISLDAPIDDAERVILDVAAGSSGRGELLLFLQQWTTRRS